MQAIQKFRGPFANCYPFLSIFKLENVKLPYFGYMNQSLTLYNLAQKQKMLSNPSNTRHQRLKSFCAIQSILGGSAANMQGPWSNFEIGGRGWRELKILTLKKISKILRGGHVHPLPASSSPRCAIPEPKQAILINRIIVERAMC